LIEYDTRTENKNENEVSFILFIIMEQYYHKTSNAMQHLDKSFDMQQHSKVIFHIN